MLADDLLSLYLGSARVVYQALPNQVGDVHMVPLLVIENKVYLDWLRAIQMAHIVVPRSRSQ
jgi:hypothetical protein